MERRSATADSATIDAVENEDVLRRSDRTVFWCLTALSVVVIVSLSAAWLSAPGWLRHPLIFSGITAIGMILLAVNQANWFILRYMKRPRWIPPRDGRRVAVVTTIVPALESLSMLEETLKALVALDYPHDTWVLDEDDDPEVRSLAQRLGVRHFSRRARRALSQYQSRSGTFQSRSKHGNYNAWLAETGYGSYDILAAFDPDHVPDRTYLSRVLGYFNDPAVAFVQAPQVYYNQAATFIARGAAEQSYGYYSYGQMGSYGKGHPVLIGCHNTQRMEALAQVGGFAAHDADDLLITLLYQSRGWKGVYVPEILAKGLAPVDWAGYIEQQRRWARAIIDIKLWHYPRIARALPWPNRMIAMLQGSAYLHMSLVIFLSITLMAVLLLLGIELPVRTVSLPLTLLLAVLVACKAFQQRFYLEPQVEAGWHWRAALLEFAKWPFVLEAAFNALRRKEHAYVLTPKKSQGPRKHVLLWPNAVVIAVLGAASLIGPLTGHAASVYLYALALVPIAGAFALIATEHLQFPSPYEVERKPYS